MNISLDNISVVSFDIFDTLLFRKCLQPSDIWELMEKRYMAKGFAAARRFADQKAYDLAAANDSDATIDDAYAFIPQYQWLKESELNEERSALTVNPEMLRIWEEAGSAGKIRVIISDMYLPQDFLEKVLIDNGVHGWDAFYLSNVQRARKTTGALYRRMLQDRAASPESVLHIGDNYFSDIVQARKVGLKTYHYKKLSEWFYEEFPFVASIAKVHSSIEMSLLLGALAIGWKQYVCDHKIFDYWDKIGYMIGGVLAYSYMRFVADEIANVDELLFVARDGYSLQKVFAMIAPSVKTKYVYAPRLIAKSSVFDVKEEYKKYIVSLNICGKVAVVDSISANFTAQRLISKTLGRKIHGFYLVTISNKDEKHYLYSPNCTLRWCHLAEFLLSAPTPPIVDVMRGQPVFATRIKKDEQLKIDVYPTIHKSLLECAQCLVTNDVMVSPETWLDYIDAFIDNLSRADVGKFKAIKNAVDVSSEKYCSVLGRGRSNNRWHWKFGVLPIRVNLHRKGFKQVIRCYALGVLKYKTIVVDL